MEGSDNFTLSQEMSFPCERVFTHHITYSLMYIMAEIQKTEQQTFRTEAQSHH